VRHQSEIGIDEVIDLSAPPLLRSCMCTQEQLESPRFQYWVKRMMARPDRLHRKIWEHCFIAEALNERDLLRPGISGLGFAVGTEPLAAMFASRGVDVCATDMDTDEAKARGWVDTNEHAAGLDALNTQNLCLPDQFRERCTFRRVDMNDIPDDLTGFDFIWSSCAFEHLGSLGHGAEFVYRSMDCLKPGGIAVHTTEYNCSSNDATIAEGGTVLFRRRDIEEIAARLRAAGHEVDVDFTAGSLPADHWVDMPPYKEDVHLKLLLDGYVISSYGLIIRKGGSPG
jgi:hypothetical protein